MIREKSGIPDDDEVSRREQRILCPTILRIASISFSPYTGSVQLFSLPSMPSLMPNAATTSSLGASTISSRSYWPSVQRHSRILAPDFSNAWRAEAARLMLSLALLIPCSVQLRSITNWAMKCLLVKDWNDIIARHRNACQFFGELCVVADAWEKSDCMGRLSLAKTSSYAALAA